MWAPPAGGGDVGDPVVQHPAARRQHPGDPSRILVDPRLADVLDHADAGHRVEGVLGQVSVVHDADLDPIGNPGLPGSLAGQLGLGLGQRDPPDHGPVLARRVDREAPPTAPDVEHPHSGLERQLATDQLQLRALGVLERLDPFLEQRAAVGHRLIQEQGEELVRDVVVVAHRLGVAALRVQAAARLELGRGGRRQARQAVRPQDGRPEAEACPDSQGRRAPAAEQGDDAVQVVDVDLAAHVGASQAELPGRPEQVPERPRRVDRQGRAGAGRGNARPIPELDRDRAVGERPVDLPSKGRRRGCHDSARSGWVGRWHQAGLDRRAVGPGGVDATDDLHVLLGHRAPEVSRE